MADGSDIARRIFAASKEVLEQNIYQVTVNGIEYKRTVPSREFYVHQWNWDSATHALGLVHWSHERAIEELLALTAGQWDNGLVPQIVFNPDESKYFPGPKFWKTDHCSPEGIQTSGISQPPVLGMSVPYVIRIIAETSGGKIPEKERGQLQLLLDRTYAFLKYLKSFRDNEDCGLITVIHPWESGLDNSPNWDDGLDAAEFALDAIPQHVIELVNENRKDVIDGANASERPEQAKYYYYMMLVDCFNNLNWDALQIVEKSPFQIKDVLFTSVFAAGCEAVSNILESEIAADNGFSNPERAQELRTWLEKSREGLENCWDEEIGGYLCQNCREESVDSKTGFTPVKVDTISKFMPLLVQVPDTETLTTLLGDLADPESFGTQYPAPSTALNAVNQVGESLFEMSRYWRGPTWPITNLLLAEGLSRYADTTPAAKLRRDTLVDTVLSLAEQIGLREYYHPVDGERESEPIGFGNFSWTAAIYIYLAEKYKKQSL
jgi:alpha,alpha-trehalase